MPSTLLVALPVLLLLLALPVLRPLPVLPKLRACKKPLRRFNLGFGQLKRASVGKGRAYRAVLLGSSQLLVDSVSTTGT